MRLKQYITVALVIILASCGGNKYLAPDFEKIAATHKVIAILPFAVSYTGNHPPFFTFKDIEFMNKKEGLAFQQSLYSKISSLNKKVVIQASGITRKRLKNLDIKNTSLSYADYCKALGVDAVVSTRISKPKLLTQLDTLGIHFPKDIKEKLKLNSTHLNDNIPQIPGNVERTVIVSIESMINNSFDNKELWHYKTNVEMKWSLKDVDVINRVSAQIAKNFPY